MIRSILTVCIGNICRSPMAEALIKERLPDVEINSAGIDALVGRSADKLAIELMGERRISIGGHRAQQLVAPFCTTADMILAMDDSQVAYIGKRYPTCRGKVFKLGKFSDFDIKDPYGGTRTDFEVCLDSIDRGVNEWVERIKLFN
ncbi:low molecular weight protein-tyrosine-phosphatase [Paraburkholderia caffeinilytica]|nr:low molecular weight protein-tyrosine-phosphatase [Paraburkholderia caffeinilytica]